MKNVAIHINPMEILIKSILCKHIPIDDDNAWGQSQKEEIWNEEETQRSFEVFDLQ